MIEEHLFKKGSYNGYESHDREKQYKATHEGVCCSRDGQAVGADSGAVEAGGGGTLAGS